MTYVFVISFDISPIGVIFVILGMVFECLSMMLLTVPIFYPLVHSHIPLKRRIYIVWLSIRLRVLATTLAF